MKSVTAQLADIAQLKTLEEEIVEQLRQADEPLTCNMLLQRIPSAPDRETLSREIFQLSKAGTIVRAGEVPAPPGMPRATVACYALPSPSGGVLGDQAAPARAATREAIAEAISGIPRDRAISKEELIARMPDGISRPAIKGGIKRMASAAQILGAFGKTTARRYYDLRTTGADSRADAALPSEPPATAKQPLHIAHEAPAAEVEFAIYNDGRLAVIDGDEILVIPPEATLRLGYFLGCLDMDAWPPRLDPAVTVGELKSFQR